jgi:hypothetical protein
MLQKFVYWTGAFDFVIAAGCWYGAISNPAAGYFVSLMTLGMFLAMAAACLMWASNDMVNRSPVIFWQGLYLPCFMQYLTDWQRHPNTRWWYLMALLA